MSHHPMALQEKWDSQQFWACFVVFWHGCGYWFVCYLFRKEVTAYRIQNKDKNPLVTHSILPFCLTEKSFRSFCTLRIQNRNIIDLTLFSLRKGNSLWEKGLYILIYKMKDTNVQEHLFSTQQCCSVFMHVTCLLIWPMPIKFHIGDKRKTPITFETWATCNALISSWEQSIMKVKYLWFIFQPRCSKHFSSFIYLVDQFLRIPSLYKNIPWFYLQGSPVCPLYITE